MDKNSTEKVTVRDKLYNKRAIYLSLVIYLLSVVFFFVSYFFITASGEDIHQGANQPANIIADAQTAFQWNGRLSDMYAWSVINFFDYQFSFGIDTIFRLVDVALIMSILYLMVSIVLGRKLRLTPTDAFLFGASFLALVLTPYGRVFYAGFSAIHNYLLIVAITLLFCAPYLRSLLGRWSYESKIFSAGMLILGLIFGMSSNTTPIAFLLTAVAIIIHRKYFGLLKQKKRELLTSWQVAGIIGAIIGIVIINVFGPGVSGYASGAYAAEYDYLSLSQIISSPVSSSLVLIKHGVINFGRILVPIIILLALLWTIHTFIKRKVGKRNTTLTAPQRSFVLANGVFVIVHMLVLSQIAAPSRIMLPAYISGVIIVLFFAHRMFDRANKRFIFVSSSFLAVTILIVVIIRSTLALQYSHKVQPILQDIKQSQQPSLCIARDSVKSKTLPFVYLGQEDMLTDWAMPQVVYGKEVRFCD